MTKGKPSGWRRLDRAERAATERGLDARKSARGLVGDLGRPAPSPCDEARRNGVVAKGPGRGERVGVVPEDACPKLLAWPYACNGRGYRRYHCSRRWRREHSAARARAPADTLLSQSRMGVDRDEGQLECMMGAIGSDIARGLSPAQIADARPAELRVSQSAAYRRIERGHGGMSDLDLRRKRGHRRRRRTAGPGRTTHGPGRSFAAFVELGDERRGGACEMDTVIGRARDEQRILTLCLRPRKPQLAILPPEKSSGAVAAAPDLPEGAVGKRAFGRTFGTILTDNGTEFADAEAIERSALPGKAARTRACYCDVRQSQQKGGRERSHAELRRLLPRRREIGFDDLTARDPSAVMSQLNSEPRPSLAYLAPASMLPSAYGGDGRALLDALGIEALPYGSPPLGVEAINRARGRRGEDALT